VKIAVTGGKGGTGKSTIATALAVELAKQHRVLLVDADADCPNDHLLLGIERKRIETVFQRIPEWNMAKCTGSGACAEACYMNAIVMVKNRPVFSPAQCNGCGACVLSCPREAISWGKKEIGWVYSGEGFNLELLSGELKVNEPLAEKVVMAMNKRLEGIAKSYDFVIVDTAAGTHCDVISALEGADLALAVSEPTPLGAHDLELIIKLLSKLGLDFEIVLNRDETGKSELIESIAARAGKKIAARVPYSKEIIKAYSEGRPVSHKSILKLKELVLK